MNFTAHKRHTAPSGTVGRMVDRFGPAPMVLLAVWSHPDDESLLAGGLLAEVAHRGGRVVNVTATSGEHGTADPIADAPAPLAARREGELAAALAVLGADPAIRLGFGDGTCDRVPDALGARAVGSVIDEVEPDVVVTFGPDGVTGHPDHQAVGRWTRDAVAERGHRIPLITTAAGAAWPSYCVDRLHTIGAFWPGYPERVLDHPGAVVHLDDDQVERKLAAIACHASQMGPVDAALGPDGFRHLASIEAYRAANAEGHRLLTAEPMPLAA